MFCPHCGCDNPDNANFCSICGAPLPKAAPKAQEQPVRPLWPWILLCFALLAAVILLLAGMLADKAYPGIMAPLLPFASEFICLTPVSPRALPGEKLADYLRGRGLNCEIYIPDRLSEGYGLNTAAIDKLADRGVTLIVTVDCGVTNIEETAYAARRGVDMIVTEYGIAKLRGRTLKQRTRALIGIAHPNFRDELVFEAKKRQLLL